MKTFEITLSDDQCDQLQFVANNCRDLVINNDDEAERLIQGIFDKALEEALASVT